MISFYNECDWISPPGATIKNYLDEKGWTIEYLASSLELDLKATQKLISGNHKIDFDLAVGLADYIGSTPTFWLKRENDYREDLARILFPEEKLKKKWLSKFPIGDMQSMGWLPLLTETNEKFQACLDYFDVESILDWDKKYSNVVMSYSFRVSETFDQDFSSTVAWLRFGEIQSEKTNCTPLNRDKLSKAIPTLRSLNRLKLPKEFLTRLKEILSNCGVILVVARGPKGCRASGASKILKNGSAVIMLSFRYLSDDQFWFTLFHEIGHVLLHKNKELFIDEAFEATNDEEEEANTFSQNILVPSSFLVEVAKHCKNFKSIIWHASQIGVTPGILLGQLQFHGYVDRKRFNFLKRRFNPDDISNFNL